MSNSVALDWLSTEWLSRQFRLRNYRLGLSGGHARIIIGAWLVASADMPPEVIESVRNLLLKAVRDKTLRKKPEAQRDALGFSLALHPLKTAAFTSLVTRLEAGDDPIACLANARCTAVYRELLIPTLKRQAVTCADNGINGATLIPGALADRLREQRYHLYADQFAEDEDIAAGCESPEPTIRSWSQDLRTGPGKTLSALQKSALIRTWHRLRRTPQTQVTELWQESDAPERGKAQHTLVGALRNLNKPVSDKEKRAVVDLGIWSGGELHELAELPTVDATNDAAHEANRRRQKAQRATRGAVLTLVESQYRFGPAILRMLLSDGLGEGLEHAGAALVAAMIAGAVLPELWREAEICFGPSAAAIRSRIEHPAGANVSPSHLHFQTGNMFCRFVPLRIAHLMFVHRSLAIEVLVAHANSWLKHKLPSLTVARLRDNLMWHLPTALGIPSIYWRLGLDPDPTSVNGDRSYIAWHPLQYENVMNPFYLSMDPQFESFVLDVSACGSPFTPTPAAIKELVAIQTRLLKEPVPKAATIGELCARLNAIASVARFIEAAVTGTRNQDRFAPHRLVYVGDGYHSAERSRVIDEKGWARVVWFASSLRRYAIRVRSVLDNHLNALRENGVRTPALDRISGSIYFVSVEGGVGMIHAPTRERCVRGLQGYHETEPFSTLGPRGPRHFANFTLRVLGFREPQILGFMDHFAARCKSSLSTHSLRIPALRTITEDAAGAIMAYCDVPQ